APVDPVLLQLEIGNAIAEQAADAIFPFEQHDVVARARELLRAREARRAGADDGDALAGLARGRKRHDPAVLVALVDDEMLDRLDPHRIAVDVERARRVAGRRADAARELGKVVRRVQDVECVFPLLPVDEVVPVGNDVVDRAAALAERNAAVHAARALLRGRRILEGVNELAIVPHALVDRIGNLRDPLQFHEAGDLPPRFPACSATDRAAAASCGVSPAGFERCARTCISESARTYSFGNTFTNFAREASQWSSIASATVEPVNRRWRSISSRRMGSSARPACSSRPLPAATSSFSALCWSLSASTGPSATIDVLHREANVPSAS